MVAMFLLRILIFVGFVAVVWFLMVRPFLSKSVDNEDLDDYNDAGKLRAKIERLERLKRQFQEMGAEIEVTSQIIDTEKLIAELKVRLGALEQRGADSTGR